MAIATSSPLPRSKSEVPNQIIWTNVLMLTQLHICAVHGFYLCLTSASWKTWCFASFLGIMAGLGVTAGAHRLWCHRSYKAKFPLRVFLALCNTIAFEKDIYNWCRDHRVHHKYSETDADPHNAKKGFFFSHVGWLMCRKHPEVLEKGKTVDSSDVLADPVVQFQRKYYYWLVLILWLAVPTAIPVVFWGESMRSSFYVAVMMRYVFMLHLNLLVNSAAHMWGNRPYDKTINPSDNVWVAFAAMGEGFHNYHHTFPWDYATSEHGLRLNITKAFIDLMAWLGLAYDLKSATPEMILNRKKRTGELCNHQSEADGEREENPVFKKEN